MATSRIFVKGLPPTFTESEFRKHFSQTSAVTDAKIFSNRRIGYVGYSTPEDAQKAIKYFNKSFIRMSRIGVELARPVQDVTGVHLSGTAPTGQRSSRADDEANGLNKLKRKRESRGEDEQDPKLKEFLQVMKPKSKRKAWESDEPDATSSADKLEDHDVTGALPKEQSDDEYEEVPKINKRTRMTHEEPLLKSEETTDKSPDQPSQVANVELEATEPAVHVSQNGQPVVSDSDWARSRTTRLLGLVDDNEEEVSRQRHDDETTPSEVESEPEKGMAKSPQTTERENRMPMPSSDDPEEEPAKAAVSADVETVRSSMRLFIRNLPYDVKEVDLEAEFASYGNLEEVHVPLDTKTGAAKGFAYIQFSDPDSAEIALQDKDGQTFQGRLMHVLPGNARKDTKLDDFALSKLPLKKQQQVKKRRDAASSNFNWNALYMNADAVVSSVADRLGLAKSDVLDPTSSDAAVKQAHAETHIIQETKAYFREHGVDLDAFKKSQRGDVAILVKNIPYDCGRDELKRLFEEHGDLKKFLIPPSGTIAVVEFANAAQCKAAFGALAYRKIKSSVLFLEKAPKGLFDAKAGSATQSNVGGATKASASDLKNSTPAVAQTVGSATLYVRNLNFSTTSRQLTDTFKPLEGFLSARVKTKTDPKTPGEVLSMGFGFLEFRTSQQAQAALEAMDGYTLEGHTLQIRASHKGADAAEERWRADAEKRTAGKKAKVVIKNLPFEATKKDVRALFGAYGQLRSVRVPKKMDRAARGFAFAEFTTPKEAESAMDALKDTHLLGRRLVIDFADEDPEDAEAELEQMQRKVGAQVNKVALQKLTSGGRKKFSTLNLDEDEN